MKKLLFAQIALCGVISLAYADPAKLPSPVYDAPVVNSLTHKNCLGFMYGHSANPVDCATSIPTTALSGTISPWQLAPGVAAANLGYAPLNPANNLGDLPSPSAARINLGLGSAATQPSTAFDAAGAAAAAQAAAQTASLQKAANLSDVANVAAARGALGAAASGVNGDIRELQGLSTPLSQAQGGTGSPDGDISNLKSTAKGATAAQTPADRAKTYLTPYDFGGFGDTQQITCTVATTSGGNIASISGADCSFTSADVGKYISIDDAGASVVTSPISSVSVGVAGSYTSMPTIAVSDATGDGAVLTPNAALATATVASGGATCSADGAQLFNVLYGAKTTAAQVTGTVTGGVLSGALTVTTAGAYSALPGSTVTLSPVSGTCGTAPTATVTWSMLAPTIVNPGYNFTAPIAAYSSGAATLTLTLDTPANRPYSGKITGVSGSSVTVDGPGFSASISGTHHVSWGPDDSPAFNALIAQSDGSGASASCANIPPARAGRYWGIAHPIIFSPNGKASCIRGAAFQTSQIMALAPITMFTDPSTGLSKGIVENVIFDGNKLATPVNLRCPSFATFRGMWGYNAPTYSTGVTIGDASRNGCNTARFVDSGQINSGSRYAGNKDFPLEGIRVVSTDNWFDNWVSVNTTRAYFHVAPTAWNTIIKSTHSWTYPAAYPATYSIWYQSAGLISNAFIDGAELNGIRIDTTGYVNVISGQVSVGAGASKAPKYGVFVDAGLAHVQVSPDFDASAVGIAANRVSFASSGSGNGHSGTICPHSSGSGNKCQTGSGFAIGSGNYSTALGGALVGSYGTLTGDYIAGVGDHALNGLTGSASSWIGLGAWSCANATGGYNGICIGNYTNSPSHEASNFINIGNFLYYNINSLSSPVISSCGASPAIDSNANNKSGRVQAGTGTVTSCTLTFAGSGYSTWNHCRVTSQSALANFAYSYTLTTITVTGTSLTGAKFDYDCDGY